MTGATAAASASGFVCAFAVASHILFVATFKVGFVPATALEAKSGGGYFLFQFVLIAGGAGQQRLSTQFLQGFVLMSASIALVFINRHLLLQKALKFNT